MPKSLGAAGGSDRAYYFGLAVVCSHLVPLRDVDVELLDVHGAREELRVGAGAQGLADRVKIYDRDMGYRYGISIRNTGDDSIDTVILDIDVGYLVTLASLTLLRMSFRHF
jgi:hypothetical protein